MNCAAQRAPFRTTRRISKKRFQWFSKSVLKQLFRRLNRSPSCWKSLSSAVRMFHWKFHDLFFRQLLRSIARPSSAEVRRRGCASAAEEISFGCAERFYGGCRTGCFTRLSEDDVERTLDMIYTRFPSHLPNTFPKAFSMVVENLQMIFRQIFTNKLWNNFKRDVCATISQMIFK